MSYLLFIFSLSLSADGTKIEGLLAQSSGVRLLLITTPLQRNHWELDYYSTILLHH